MQPRGLLRVSAPTTWGSCVLAPVLSGLLRAQPLLNVELDLSNRRVDLIEDGFDVAIRVGPLPSQEVVARPLPPYAMSLAQRRPSAQAWHTAHAGGPVRA